MAIQTRKLKNGQMVHRVFVRDHNGEWFNPIRQFDTKGAAREHEAELIAQRSRGAKTRRGSAKDLTFSEYWNQWKDKCRTEVSKGWQMTQDQMFKDHINPYLGEKKIIEIEKSDIAGLLAHLKVKEFIHLKTKRKMTLGDQSRIHVFQLVHKMFDDAIEVFDYRDSNPVLKRFKPQAPVIDRAFFKPKQAHQFLDFVSEHWMGVAFWIMTICGLRTGEMQTLQIGDIHLDDPEPCIHLQRQWNRKEKRITSLKNGKPIRIPIPDRLAEYLRGKLPKDAKPTDLVIKGRRFGRMLNHGTIQKVLQQICKDAGLHKVTPHELRHTCAELWKDSGATTKDLQNLFNHSSEQSTKRYEHKVDERLNRISVGVATKEKTTRLTVVS